MINDSYVHKLNIDDLDILKHIGKGSFSNVYLCKNNKTLDILNLYNDSYTIGSNEPEFFIVKEININKRNRISDL